MDLEQALCQAVIVIVRVLLSFRAERVPRISFISHLICALSSEARELLAPNTPRAGRLVHCY